MRKISNTLKPSHNHNRCLSNFVEPDGSETDGSVKAELEMPAHALEEKHCHCICHMHRPGMKLVWIPLEENDKNNTDERAVQTERSSTPRASIKSKATANNPTSSTQNSNTSPANTPQCNSCVSFRLHHGPQEGELNESMYESMELFFSYPPEEPLYLELQPSDPPPSSPSPPKPPPRPLATLRSRNKERWNTQPVLACMLSPRGGRPPMRSRSSCGTEIVAPAKLKKGK